MAQIVPKLNLNKTPASIETNSLVFAKNIRLDVDSSIHEDYGVFPMSIHKGQNINRLVNYNNILNRVIVNIETTINAGTSDRHTKALYDHIIKISGKEVKDENNNVIASKGTYKIVGIIANSNEFYIFINGSCVTGQDSENKDITETYDFIICYDEKEDRFYPCNCNWHWSGGTITGCVVNNLLGEKILNIGEKDATSLVPLKCINLNTSSIEDDERLYTQTPNIPITNLGYIGSFSYTVPNGVYQFFVRYKIRDDFYTDWFPASKELFAGNTNTTDTSFGTVKYVNTNRDSDNSFKFSVEHLFIEQASNYESFQVGFIVSHDDSIVARAWKHFGFDVSLINFDYNANDAYDIEVIDVLKNVYQLYNVGNITSFKNKLYVANYKEFDFNENYQTLADQIGIEITDQTATSGYGGNSVIETTLNGKTVISGITTSDGDVLFSGENGIIDQLLRIKSNGNTITIVEAITDAITDNVGDNATCGAKKWDISLSGTKDSLGHAKTKFENSLISKTDYSDFTYSTDIKHIKVGGSYVTLSENKDTLLSNILSAIYGKTRYMNENCVFVNDEGVEDYKLDIEIIRDCSYKYTQKVSNGLSVSLDNETPNNNSITRPREDETIGGVGYNKTITVPSTYTQTITLRLKADRSKYKVEDESLITGYTTLIPYQKYKFYVHYVKQNGETTNGYYCNGKTGGIKEVPYRSSANAVIFPKFTNISLPEGYVACFFSVVHVENIAATVFNIDTDNENGEASCMDANVGLISAYDKLTIKQGFTKFDGGTGDIGGDVIGGEVLNPDFPLEFTNITPSVTNTTASSDQNINVTTAGDTSTIYEIKTNSAKYYYSSDTSNTRYFGADGVIQFDKLSNISAGKFAYLVQDYNIAETDDLQLTKCTPFIDPTTLSTEGADEVNIYSAFDNMNLLGFICAISPLNRATALRYYTDGSSVFIRKSSTEATFCLTELKTHLNEAADGTEKVTAFDIQRTNRVYIYSNYNLNYLALTEDVIDCYKTYYDTTTSYSSEEESSSTTVTKTMLLRILKSPILSSTYLLPEMYKTYTKKTYSLYKQDEIIEFNNTIRASQLEGDEYSINVYKFDPNDYYNIPTNRGIIVNLISVGDVIIAHTEDSMFKFTGNNTIQSSDGEIQPSENDVFDTGVSEVFGSDFGYAGLQRKTDTITTELGYIFFDRDSRVVYMYSGQSQIEKLSDSIEKLFRHRPIENIRFANDYYNNRFFVSILFYEDTTIDDSIVRKYYPVTLSYNVAKDIKSFVSLHDFYYDYAFNTKTTCYFLTTDRQDICTIDKDHKGWYTKLELSNDQVYLQRQSAASITLATNDTTGSPIRKYDVNVYNSIVDIIDNNSYEYIKTLNAVNWCGSKITSEFKNISFADVSSFNMVEEVNKTVPCSYIRIYSDTCMTDLLPCTQRANDKDIATKAYYKYPYYNQGSWTCNYFRNILNSKGNSYRYDGDNNSLIEGKYFVIRFVFDRDFKLETMYLNYNRK